MRQLAAAILLSALAIAAMMGALGTAGAADLPQSMRHGRAIVDACAPKENVILFEKERSFFFHTGGTPTRPARTPYFTCITGLVLLPGEIPPPPEYCCS